MKRIILFLTTFVLFILSINAQQKLLDNQFYYYRDKKVNLQIDSSRIYVISEGRSFLNNTKGVIKTKNLSVQRQGQIYTRQNVKPLNGVTKIYQNKEIDISEIDFSKKIKQADYSDIIQNLSKEDSVIKVGFTYTISNKKFGISNNFYVKLYKEDDMNNLINLANKYSIQILGINEFMPLWVTLSCSRETSFDALEAANLFYETGLFESAEPEFLYQDLLLSNDTYFSSQWNLNNTGQYGGTSGMDVNAVKAWTISTGTNVKVAVFDQGFEMNHPDLLNNVYGTGYDAYSNTTPSIIWGDHATACAGIIGAQQNNGIGITGIAPNSKLMSISIDLSFADTPQQLSNGFNWALNNGADIISNSWGGYVQSSILDDAINSFLIQGRNGKGGIVVFAAGNENNTAIRYPGNSNPDILVVGAISPCGQRKSPTSCDGEDWGSCYGPQLDVVAPGVLISTTDRQGANGYNPNESIHIINGGNKITSDFSDKNYTVWFNGTSAACPLVAGIAALILSANPNLTSQQVGNIIESTSRKVGGYNYQTTTGRPNGTWNNEMGYGLVDAYAAVQAAALCVNDFINTTVTANTNVTGCSNLNVQNVKVQNNAKLTLNSSGTITINGAFEVAFGSQLEVK